MPATLALTLGTPPTFGAFTPGVAKDYTASTTANVISTAGDAALTVSDPGHLMNGTYALPSALRGRLLEVGVDRAGRPTRRSRSTSSSTSAPPTRCGPGSYSKTLTFTLSTTQP